MLRVLEGQVAGIMTHQGTELHKNMTDLPPLVRQALELAERLEFDNSCRPEVGRLLRVLASHCRGRLIGEIGTGCGVGTAWMASAIHLSTRLVTVEIDLARAVATRELFGAQPNVRVLMGDWRTLAAEGPFALLFADGGRAKEHVAGVLSLVEPGGLVVIDDLTPGGLPDRQDEPDPVRTGWLNRDDVAATEVLVTSETAAILAVRLR